MSLHTEGSLVVVGTGMSVAHLTRESIAYIEGADIVLYCVADIATERLIAKLNANTEDLYYLYANDKLRSQTYAEMTDRIMHFVEGGKNVCVAFYGHAGIFAQSTHAAIDQARSKGIPATMLPAVSCLDCLFADLGVDPATHGCQILEATHYMCRNRVLDPYSAVILLQIGCVGDWGWSTKGYDGRNVRLLAENLEKIYGQEYEVVVYCASTLPLAPPLIQVTKLKDLDADCVSGISTLYIPPLGSAPVNTELVQKFKEQREATLPLETA